MTTPAQPNPPSPVMYRVLWRTNDGSFSPQRHTVAVSDPVQFSIGWKVELIRFLHPSGSLHVVRDDKLVEICEHGKYVGKLCELCAPLGFYGPARSCARPLSEQQQEEVKSCATKQPSLSTIPVAAPETESTTQDVQTVASSGAVRSEPASAPEGGTPMTDAVEAGWRDDYHVNARHILRFARDLERKLAESEKELREVTKHHDGQTEFWYNRNKEQTDKLTAANLRAERAEQALRDAGWTLKEGAGRWKPPLNEAMGEMWQRLIKTEGERDVLADRVKELDDLIAGFAQNANVHSNASASMLRSCEEKYNSALAQLDSAQVAMSILDSAAKLLTAQGRPCSAEEVARLLNAAKGWGDAPECGIAIPIIREVDAKEGGA